MTEFRYAEWRNRRPFDHPGVSFPAFVCSTALSTGSVAAAFDSSGEPVPREFFDHPLLFLCIILLLCAIIVVMNVSRRNLQSSERRYRALFTDNGAIMLLIEPASLRIMDANPAACAFYGLSPDDLLSKKINDINILPEPEVRELLHDVLNYEKRRFLARHRLASGEERDVEVNSMPYRLEGRECLLSIIHDITAQVAAERERDQIRQQAEAALRQTSEELRAIYDGNIDGIIVADIETGEIVQVNEQACRMFGYSRDELLHKNPLKDLHPPETVLQVKKYFAELRDGIESRQEDICCLRADGSIFYADIGARLITLNGRLCAAGFFHDITVRKATEELFHEGEQRWQFAIRGSRDGVWDWNLVNDTTYFSPRWKELIGYEDHELPNRFDSWRDNLHPDDLALALSALERYFTHETEIFEIEVRMRCKDGSWRWILSRGMVTSWSEEGRPLRMIGTHTDIQHKVQTENLLRESEERYRRISNLTSDFVYSCRRVGDAPYRIDWIAGAFEAISGYPLRKIEERGCWLPYLHEDDREYSYAMLHDLLPGNSVEWECRLVAHSGEVRWLRNHATSATGDDGCQILVGAAQDITERKLAFDRLSTSEERYRLIFETTLEGIFQTTPAGRYQNVNPAFARMLGYDSPDELMTAISDIGTQLYVDPEQRATIKRKLADEEQIKGFEAQLHHKDGGTIWVLINASAFRDESGEITYYQGGMIDITERKQDQERILASLREKEMLLKEIHHRVKNNLQIISSLLNLQVAHINDEKLIPLFRESQNRVRTMSLIHEKLYRSDNLAYIDFGAYLQELATSLFRSFHMGAQGATLDIDAEPITFGIVTAVPCGLLVNELVSNALKYAFPGGRHGTLRVELHRNADATCSLIVADTGVGLPDGFDIEKTESLGMELIRSLTQQLDGKLEINCSGGTAFIITFTHQE